VNIAPQTQASVARHSATGRSSLLRNLNTRGDDRRSDLREVRSDKILRALALLEPSRSANPVELQFKFS
jgi:propanediol dehydratase small subunit